MKRYRRIVSAHFGGIFILGGIAHFAIGRLEPGSYQVFADTALVP